MGDQDTYVEPIDHAEPEQDDIRTQSAPRSSRDVLGLGLFVEILGW